jgi:hypothetical protein
MLSDDDTLKENSVSIFFDKLNRYKYPAVLFLNYSECNTNMKERLCRYREDISHDTYCENGDMFFQESKFLFGLISSLVIRRQSWNLVNVRKYIGSGFVHVGTIVEILRDQPSLIVSNKLINLRMGNSRGNSREGFLYDGFNLVKIFQGMRSFGYKKKTYEYLIGNMYKANLKALLVANSQGLKNKKRVAVEMMKCYRKHPFFWIIHLPFLFIPNIVFIFLRKIKRFFKYRIIRIYGK